jgi:tetratricopeptide (TPR) repeat protein
MHPSIRINTLLFFLTINLLISAQPYKDPKYGADSASRMRCAQNLSILGEYMNINLYNYALEAFETVFTECPTASKNIYVHGARIYKYLIENEKDETLKSRRIDSLMLIYDQRARYFREEGLVKGKKGMDLVRYTTRLQDGYNLLKESISLVKEKSEDGVLAGFMQVSVQLLKSGTISQADFLTDYSQVSAILDIRKGNEPDQEKVTRLAETITGIFMSVESIDCRSLTGILEPAFNANMEDADWLKKACSMLEGSKCQESGFYLRCSEQLYALQPSAEAAASLASLFLRNKDELRSMEFFAKAAEAETNSEKKARYLYMVAVVKGKDASQYKEARALAQEAIRLNPAWGEPYLLIGNMYASSAKTCGSNEFEQKAIYWVAVDQYMKAKSIDPGVTEEANRLINQYTPYFPNKESAFFSGFTEGNTYSVGCWINESTRVRF